MHVIFGNVGITSQMVTSEENKINHLLITPSD